MLQFITTPGAGTLSPTEQARQAIAGGCRWIVIDIPGATDNDIRNAAMDLINECEDTNTFLLIRGHIDVVDELKVSGIQVGSIEEGAEARKRLGAHAIIGVEATTADEVKQLKPLDLDYAFLPIASPDNVAAIVAEVKEAGVDEPVVAGAGVTLDNLEQFMATGAHGVAMGDAIAAAPDPMLYTMKVMERLIPVKP